MSASVRLMPDASRPSATWRRSIHRKGNLRRRRGQTTSTGLPFAPVAALLTYHAIIALDIEIRLRAHSLFARISDSSIVTAKDPACAGGAGTKNAPAATQIGRTC